jgi:hypothetical protein
MAVAVLAAMGAALPAPAQAKLRFFLADGKPIRFAPRTTIQCGVFDRGEPRSLRLVVGQPVLPASAGSYWMLQISLSALAHRRSFDWPLTSGGSLGAILFASEIRSGNELTSAGDDARGRILVHSAGCLPHPHIAFSVYGHLDSELGDRTGALVYGSMRAGRRSR